MKLRLGLRSKWSRAELRKWDHTFEKVLLMFHTVFLGLGMEGSRGMGLQRDQEGNLFWIIFGSNN